MSRLSICIAITWMAVFWPMACRLADGSASVAGPSGPLSLHFKRPGDGGMLAASGRGPRMVLDATRPQPAVD